MRVIEGGEAWVQLAATPHSRWRLARGVAVRPVVTAKFRIEAGARFFCIGSCFARHLEKRLQLRNFPVDSLLIAFPSSEWSAGGNGLLNKFTTMSLLNELEWAFGASARPSSTCVEISAGYLDCQLTAAQIPVSLERAIERRVQICEYFARARDADVIVLTLGLIEAWYDKEMKLYLNMAPPLWSVRRNGRRFAVHLTTHDENAGVLRRTIELIHDAAPRAKILVTISPVPMTQTFSGQDVRVANCQSKSVLRSVAGDVTSQYDFADYYPSFEAVQSAPPDDAFESDRVHVRDGLVTEIVDDFVASYHPVG